MNNTILKKAKYIAQKLPDQKYKIVAIITDKRNRILSIGTNSYKKSHPTQAYYAEKIGNRHQIFLHAEIDALIRCTQQADNIYIIRLNNNNKSFLAKPCALCKMAIKDAGIKNIYHT